MSTGQTSPEGLGRPFALVGALVVAGLLVTAGRVFVVSDAGSDYGRAGSMASAAI